MKDIIRCEHCDPDMAVLGVVTGEEGPAGVGRGGDIREAGGSRGGILGA
ncbi:MAG: hypothetical protein OXF11_17780 [Deltaproteobacteria bacterium]|nr:hypothetical protein [Deltaproteobacteria bacterium]